MSTGVGPNPHLEIAHVLFIDIVGYSKLLTDEQRELQQLLNQVVRRTGPFREAEAAGKLGRLPTGDGMALLFFTRPEAPAECAVEISEAIRDHSALHLRMGVHSGPVSGTTDVNDRTNFAGAGINMAQRVMACGDAGHILLSKRAAGDLAEDRQWAPFLHDCGEIEVKHGVRIEIVNFYTATVGNSKLPEKLTRANEEEAALSRAPALRRRKRALLVTGILLSILLAGLFFIFRNKPAPTPTRDLPAKSIAVLPFENLSAEKDDAFFADGIQDDVLTSLGKIKDLTVIARASVMVYRGAALGGKLREIGKTLSVAHVLAGSVRRSANRVVVSVQLIDTRDDHQLWSERYERTLSDALSLQGELAIEIARELRATLTPAEKNVVATKPTENPDAYVLYLRARKLEIGFDPWREDIETALKLYQQAVDLDPKFALARARLSLDLTFLTSHFEGKDSPRAPKALAEAEEALRLQPNSGEARLALGYYHFRVRKDFDRALAELARAAELMPNSAEVWNTRAQIYKPLDRFRERIAALQRAEVLDPRDTTNLGLSAMTFCAVRNWPEVTRTLERAKAVLPSDEHRYFWWFAYNEFRRTGVLDPLKKAIAEAPKSVPPGDLSLARCELAMLERDFSAAERFLRETPEAVFDNWTGVRLPPPKVMEEALLAIARGGDPAMIERALLTAREQCEKLLSANPDDFSELHGALGLIDAFRGRKEDAIREGRRCVELQTYSILEKNDAAANLALIYARTGEPDEALKLIEKLMSLPANLNPFAVSSMTQAELKWRWVWDPLRGDPRFQKILAGPEPKTIY
jgi:serine/threonine-protein kinase